MKKFNWVLLLFFLTIKAISQAPLWSVDENQFEYTMTFQSFLNTDGVTLSNENDRVAAFVNGECRGVANLTYVEDVDRYFAFLTVFANDVGDTVSFKMYDAAKNQITDAETTVNFEIGAHYGNSFQAYSIASPILNSEATIASTGIENVRVLSIQNNGGTIRLYVDEGTDISQLAIVFEISEGASVYHDGVLFDPNGSPLDFGVSNPLLFTILSENQSIAKEVYIYVESIDIGNELKFYKKDGICNFSGAIKVELPVENAEVLLYKDGNFVEEKKIVDGETIFNGLVASNYLIKIGDFDKEIKIAWKNKN